MNMTALIDSRMSPGYLRAVSDFVRHEVICCVTGLVSELAKDEKYRDNLMPVLSRSTWTHALEYTCAECGESYQREDNEPRAKEWTDPDEVPESLGQMACPKCGHKNLPDHVRATESDPEEACEHWIVSDYLADKLEDKGEMILRDFLGRTIWGRTTTGQAVAMDGVIQEIYDEMRRA